MASIGLNPPKVRGTEFETRRMTVATGKKGMLVVPSGDGTHDGAKIATTAGETKLLGVIKNEGDPNNSGLFPTGANVSVQKDGPAEVLFDAAEAITEGDTIIASGTDGHAKVLGAEGKPYTVLGYAAETRTIGAAAGFASVNLQIHTVPA